MFGDNLKKLRKERGISQKKLADDLFMSQQAIAKWELDKASPNPEMVKKIAEYFGVTTDHLLGREETKKATDNVGDSYSPKLSEKDELDISKKLNAMLEELSGQGGALMFDGEPLDDESRELLISSLENSIRMAKLIAKQKYTPKKYRKGAADD